MPEKEIEMLQAEKEKVERQLAQEQHKIQRLENRAAYYEKGKRRKRVQHIHSHAVPRENTRFSSFFDFTVLRPPGDAAAPPFRIEPTAPAFDLVLGAGPKTTASILFRCYKKIRRIL